MGRDGDYISQHDISSIVRKVPSMDTRIPELGRFAEPALLILVSLSDGPKHGYAIMGDVEAGTGRPLGPGTLYAALARLEERGLIEALPPVDRRRPYRLTAVGATILAEQLHELSEFAQLGLARLGRSAG
jgi:DNA-binding PadR family transcriptional regulator